MNADQKLINIIHGHYYGRHSRFCDDVKIRHLVVQPVFACWGFERCKPSLVVFSVHGSPPKGTLIIATTDETGLDFSSDGFVDRHLWQAAWIERGEVKKLNRGSEKTKAIISLARQVYLERGQTKAWGAGAKGGAV